MVAVSVPMRYRPYSRRHKNFLAAGLLALTGAGLMSCASTQELYAEYDQQFCPVDGVGVAVPASTPVSTPAPEPKIVERVVIREVPAAAATLLTWEPAVYYQSDSATLSTSARGALDNNVKVLRKFPGHLVAVRGFTDSHSSAAYNRKLAEKRVAGVKSYLAENGISSMRVVGTSHGESLPLADGQTAIADNINRRVELLLLDSNGRPLASRQQVVLGPAKDD